MLKFCSQPWDTVSILQDGSVQLCMCGAWNRVDKVGSLRTTSLSDIMASRRATTFRNSIIDQSFQYCEPTLCPELNRLPLINNLDNIEPPSLPTTLHLQVDINCNLKCASCRNSQTYSSQIDPNAKQTLDALCRAYENFKPTVMVYGDGAGDCFASAAWREFFNSNNLPRCFKFNLTTNGNLLTKNLDTIDKIKPQLHSVIVSLDAATPDTYKKTRGGNFALVLDGIRALVDRKVAVHTQFVLQYLNHHELLDYQKLAKSLGVATFGLQKFHYWSHMTNEYYLANRLENNNKINQKLLLDSLRQVTEDPMCINGTGINFFVHSQP
jgi:MoaA/NifB/PqqE/SkfB family radical SAM enzyme